MTDETLIDGRYRLGRRIGRGGMAEVRLALDTQLGRTVAIKQLSPELAVDPDARIRFRQEAWSAASLHHPNIVAVFDTGEHANAATGVSCPFIVMELVEGQNFASMLRRGETLTPTRALQLTQGMLDALAFSHEAGIVHQDIKPGNLMLSHRGEVKLLDFGIARTPAAATAPAKKAALVLGTAKYLSPEQACGTTTDPRSDVYSAGCVMYELLVGRPPFTGESVSDIISQHLSEPPAPPSRINAAVGPEVDTVVLTALAKSPAGRYRNAREMKNHVDALLRARPAMVAAPVATESDDLRVVLPRRHRPRRAAPVASRRILTTSACRRRGALITSAVVAVLFPLGGLGLYNMNDSDRETQEAEAATVLQVPKPADPSRAGLTDVVAQRPVPQATKQEAKAKQAVKPAATAARPAAVARPASPHADVPATTVRAPRVEQRSATGAGSGTRVVSAVAGDTEPTARAAAPARAKARPAEAPRTAEQPARPATKTQSSAARIPSVSPAVTKPVKRTKPAKATKPARATKPAKPAKTTKPVKRTKPARAARPAAPAPSQPVRRPKTKPTHSHRATPVKKAKPIKKVKLVKKATPVKEATPVEKAIKPTPARGKASRPKSRPAKDRTRPAASRPDKPANPGQSKPAAKKAKKAKGQGRATAPGQRKKAERLRTSQDETGRSKGKG